MSRELMLEKIVKAQERITRDREQVSSGNMRGNGIILWPRQDG